MSTTDSATRPATNPWPDQVSYANSALESIVSQQLQLENELRAALSNEEMELAYQPIVDQTGAIIMAEALLRWQHPTRGALSPGKILQVAESGGLMR